MISTLWAILVAIVGYVVAFFVLVVSFICTMAVLLFNLIVQFIDWIIPIIEKLF